MDVAEQGEVSAGFESVRDAFVNNWQRIEVGASLTVYHGEKKVVDLWGGYQDSDFSRPWEKDTLVNTASIMSLDQIRNSKHEILNKFK